MDQAESTEDVKKFFVYTVQELFKDVFGDSVEVAYDDVVLTPGDQSHYRIKEEILRSEPLISTCRNSDLPDVLSRLAESAVNRYRHLDKNPEKTELKIRMRPR